jgi:hypothetical protein
LPFDEGLTVKTRQLDAHDGPGRHLFHGVRWGCDDGGHETVSRRSK